MERWKLTQSFVNQVFAVLLGVNAALWFALDPVASLFTVDSIALVFAMAVVVCYWWRWTGASETSAPNSPRQFLLTFLVLLGLETLFVYHREIESMMLTLVALGAIDTVWLAPRSFASNNREEEFRRLRVLSGKLFALLLLLCAWALIAFLPALPLVELLFAIAAFVVGRLAVFPYSAAPGGLKIGPAREEDAFAIGAIGKYGFAPEGVAGAVEANEPREIAALIEADRYSFLVARREGGGVVGYVRLSSEVDDAVLKNVRWRDEGLRRQTLYNAPLFLTDFGARQGFAWSSVASAMLREASVLFPARPLVFVERADRETEFLRRKPIERAGFRYAASPAGGRDRSLAACKARLFVRTVR